MKPRRWLQLARDLSALPDTQENGLNLDYQVGDLGLTEDPCRGIDRRPDLPDRTGNSMSFDTRRDPDRVFLEALSAGELVVQNCLGCGTYRAPPSDCCPDCGDIRHAWKPSAGMGRLERAMPLGEVDAFGDDPEVTRAIGAVQLVEGPTVSVRLIGSIPPVGADVCVKVLSGSLIAEAR